MLCVENLRIIQPNLGNQGRLRYSYQWGTAYYTWLKLKQLSLLSKYFGGKWTGLKYSQEAEEDGWVEDSSPELVNLILGLRKISSVLTVETVSIQERNFCIKLWRNIMMTMILRLSMQSHIRPLHKKSTLYILQRAILRGFDLHLVFQWQQSW